ncbi:MAG: hypothetical protein H0V45_09285 [Actinobacteria bacterium]|nr:hypothetical protein [Actinomycetota bacterium]
MRFGAGALPTYRPGLVALRRGDNRIEEDAFEQTFHVRVPAGTIPKDGPSSRPTSRAHPAAGRPGAAR